jgi:hypothetical protein
MVCVCFSNLVGSERRLVLARGVSILSRLASHEQETLPLHNHQHVACSHAALHKDGERERFDEIRDRDKIKESTPGDRNMRRESNQNLCEKQ